MTMENQQKGIMIVIEGMDGSGKQTQAELLYNRLVEQGRQVKLVSFPNYENESSILVQRYLQGNYHTRNKENNITFVKQMSSFYAVDRVASFIDTQYDGKSLLDLLEDGYIIICDRYTTSNMLHQSGNLSNKDQIPEYLEWIERLEFEHLGLPKPDMVLYLDIEPSVSVANIKKRYKGEAKEDLHENINHFYDVYNNRKTVIGLGDWFAINCDSNGEMKTKEEIHTLLYRALQWKGLIN